MEYSEFVDQYEALVSELMGYSPEEVGSVVFASRLADLCEAHPEFEAMYDSGM